MKYIFFILLNLFLSFSLANDDLEDLKRNPFINFVGSYTSPYSFCSDYRPERRCFFKKIEIKVIKDSICFVELGFNENEKYGDICTKEFHKEIGKDTDVHMIEHGEFAINSPEEIYWKGYDAGPGFKHTYQIRLSKIKDKWVLSTYRKKIIYDEPDRDLILQFRHQIRKIN